MRVSSGAVSARISCEAEVPPTRTATPLPNRPRGTTRAISLLGRLSPSGLDAEVPPRSSSSRNCTPHSLAGFQNHPCGCQTWYLMHAPPLGHVRHEATARAPSESGSWFAYGRTSPLRNPLSREAPNRRAMIGLSSIGAIRGWTEGLREDSVHRSQAARPPIHGSGIGFAHRGGTKPRSLLAAK